VVDNDLEATSTINKSKFYVYDCEWR
jgi:hypothetical protein